MKFHECQHVFSNGVTCHAPRLRQHRFCYFHVAARDRIRRQRLAAEKKLPLQIPLLEDNVTIQLAIGDVVNAMLCDRIDPRKAALALYGLQTAAANMKSLEIPRGKYYREYIPELDTSLPELPRSESGQAPSAPAPEPFTESTTIEEAPAKIPPKKPVSNTSAARTDLSEFLRNADRAQAKAIRRYTRAFNAGTAEPLPWVVDKYNSGKWKEKYKNHEREDECS